MDEVIGEGEDCIMRLTKDHSGDSNQRECAGRGMWHVLGRREVHAGFWWGNLRERDYLEDLGVAGRKILKWAFKTSDGDMDNFDLAQDRGSWPALVNAAIILWVP
jgi:hypothetical protein